MMMATPIKTLEVEKQKLTVLSNVPVAVFVVAVGSDVVRPSYRFPSCMQSVCLGRI